MLNDHVVNLIKKNLLYTPTEKQDELIQKLASFVLNPANNPLFLLKGYAGTGKTSLIAALVGALNEMKVKSILMAPTGRAAKVMSSYSSAPATTIHKRIYRQKSLSEGFGLFSLDRNMHSDTVFIVDEASMIANGSRELTSFGSGDLLEDMINYVKSGVRCKLLIVGDNAQLPPVGSSRSPALEYDRLNSYSACDTIELTEVVRQGADSGILFNATCIRQQIAENRLTFPLFKLTGFPDIELVGGAELIDKISDAYAKYGTSETIVVCRSNRRAYQYNQGVRAKILYAEDEITQGDRVMVVKNNYQSLGENDKMDFIANGDMATIRRIKKYSERHGMRYADIALQFEDYDGTEIDTKIMIDTLAIESASLPAEKNKELFYSVAEDYADMANKQKRYNAIREDPYFNALQVKFAYAITCHKAQGGQWKCVFLDRPYFGEGDDVSLEDLRWMYTALTRASEKVYLVNFEEKYLI